MQNEINLTLTPAQLQTVDDSLTALENTLQALTVLTPEEKNAHVKAPENSRDWMNNMLARAEQNLQHLPRDFDSALVQTDLNLMDALASRLLRLHRLADQVESSVFLAGSEAFADLLEVRRRLQDANVAGVDDNLNEGMQRFFNCPKRTKAKPAA